MFYQIEPSEKIAVIASDGSVFTYADLDREVKAVGAYLESRKLAFCLCENSPSSLIGYLGCLNKKTVPLLLDKKIDAQLLQHLLQVYKPDYLLVPQNTDKVFDGYEEVAAYGCYRIMKRSEEMDTVLYEDLALLLTTSGSTGSPKLVRQSYRNIQSNAEAIVKYLEIGEDEKAITTLPMNYTYGLSIINSHLQAGATILMTDQPMNMKAFWDFAKGQEATSFGGVPFTYEMLKRVRFFKMDLPSIRYMTQAGGKLDPLLHKEFAEWCFAHGKKFIVMYGQTEATARMGYLPAENSIEKYGCIGFPIPGGKFVLIDAAGEEIHEPETVGELVYEGENVTLGYAQEREDLSKGDERNGRLETGDMAKYDKDGFYSIVGRKKRFLKIFGNRVNLDEIDRLLKREFPDVEFASTGVDDHMKTYVTSEEILTQVRKWLSETTHLSESAFETFYLPEIPKNEAGKILYKDLPQ